MVIKEIDKISLSQLSSPKKLTESVGFEKILGQKLSKISETNQVRPLKPSTDLIDQSSKVLDLLDEYINQLNDPVKTLKDMDPLVRAIEKEVKSVEEETSDHIGRDTQIEGFFNDLAITANVALFKFQRGDFL
jgi:hypothetical protein